MTIVVYRKGIIAADSAGWRGDFKAGSFVKIVKTSRGLLAGGAGEAGCIQRFFAWADDGCSEDKRPEMDADAFDGFTVDAHGTILGYGHRLYPFVVDAEFYGVGSGYPVALGALVMNATAERACHIACDYGEACRGPVITLRF